MSEIIENGDCFSEFLGLINYHHGQRSAEQTRRCATRVVDHCVTLYNQRFGSSDVGRGGLGRVSRPFAGSADEPIPLGTNGLLYGRVQSGKTHASIATVALAFENGFRCFVLLTSNNVWLAEQTYGELRDKLGDAGPVVKKWDFWHEDPEGVGAQSREALVDGGLVLVCPKNVHHLRNLIAFLQSAGAAGVPGLILDDEADNASLNTSAAKQAREGRDIYDDPSATFAQIAEIRKAVANHIFLQVTATPQSLLLQGLDHPSRPLFAEISPVGDDYMGGNVFFSPNSAYVVPVDADELDELKGGEVDPGVDRDVPKGLRLALCCFCIGAAYKRLTDRNREVYSFLAHICHKKVNHKNVAARISTFLLELGQALRGNRSDARKAEAEKRLKEAREELLRTAPALPPLTELVAAVDKMLRHAATQIINADNPNTAPDYKPGLNVLIGGNRLGRGVTIKGLMTTYYGRDAKQKMMDTVHQHARMFGYRRALLDVTRLFTAPHILDAFRLIHTANEAMLEAIGDDPAHLELQPVWVGQALKPTRANVLNPSQIGAIRSNRLWPREPLFKRQESTEHTARLDELLAPYCDNHQYYEVDLEFMARILAEMPGRSDSVWNWQYDRAREILEALRRPPFNVQKGRLNVRRGLRIVRKEPSQMDYIQGEWAKRAEQDYPQQPTLIVMKQEGQKIDKWEGVPFYVPTLVVPTGNYVFMFNLGEDSDDA
jgi:Z1 domain